MKCSKTLAYRERSGFNVNSFFPQKEPFEAVLRVADINVSFVDNNNMSHLSFNDDHALTQLYAELENTVQNC